MNMPVALTRMLDHHGDVLQMSLPDGDASVLREVVGEIFEPKAALVTDHEPVVPNLFVSDMDSTIIAQECIDELADYAGLKPQIANITERAMRGELPFEAALRERVRLLKGLEEAAIAQCLNDRIAMNAGARALVGTLKAHGCKTVLVTGGFHHFADAIARQAGFDRVIGNRLAIRDGVLTGELEGPIVDAATKRTTLLTELELLGDGAVSMAAGDGANDIPMLEAADYGIAYNAKPAARAAANSWIEGGSLTDTLKLLHIPREKWVAG
ncbi:MAG: phosphoserine phosphatase SerB [Pontixanthobacter sp.]